MEKLQEMKNMLTEYIYDIMNKESFEDIDAAELGEAIDMIKDLSEAAYYCSITK